MNFEGLLPALLVSGLLLICLMEPAMAQTQAAPAELKLSERLGAMEMSTIAPQSLPAPAPTPLVLAMDHDVRDSLIRRILLLKGQTMLGAAYAYGSMEVEATDCSGLVGQVFESAGISLPRASRDIATVGQHVAEQDMQVGDVVIYRFRSGLHAAIYVGDDQILHASPKHGVVKTALDSSWRKRMVTARRII